MSRVARVALVSCIVATIVLAAGAGSGCVSDGPPIKKFAPPPDDVMPRRIIVMKRGEFDQDLDSYIDGVLVEAYLLNNDRTGEGADQPFLRDGTLKFRLFDADGTLFCEGEFSPAVMARSESDALLGPGYALQIMFGPRGYDDVRDRMAARMDFEFTPSAAPEQKAFGSTQVRLGPMF
ncbi:MAG: hypothetical protein RIE77_03520 [Phycisphaerales bacterium]